MIVTIEQRDYEAENNEKDKEWLTAAQLLDRYKDQEVVDAIVADKKQVASQWRPHPDAPKQPKAIQFHVQTLDKQSVSSGVSFHRSAFARALQLQHATAEAPVS